MDIQRQPRRRLWLAGGNRSSRAQGSSRRRWVRFAVAITLMAAAASAASPLAGILVVVAAVAWVVINVTTCDPVTLLTLYLILLFGIPGVYIFKPLGAIGTPAALVALIAVGWWATSRLSLSTPSALGFQPVRLAVLAFFGAMVVTWGMGFVRPLSALQMRSADRSLIGTLALCGSALLAADGIATRERLDTLLKRLVDAGTFLGGLGILQFTTGLNPAQFLRFPGLALNGDLNSISERSSFRRVSGTALHGIDFGVVLTLILPIALHYAMDAPREQRVRRWVPVGIIMVAVPMSVSRSALVGLVAVGLMLLPTWAWRRRVNVAVVVGIGAMMMRAIVPGLLGTLRSLVTGASSDPSVLHRTGDTALVFARFVHAPWLGQGFGTYIPQQVRFLDNQYYGTIVETGLLGLTVVLALLGVAMGVSRGGRRRSTDPAGRSLGQALAASVLVAFLTFGTFDALGFPMNASVVFFVIGCAGAFWRLADEKLEPGQRFPASASAGQLARSMAAAPEPVAQHH